MMIISKCTTNLVIIHHDEAYTISQFPILYLRDYDVIASLFAIAHYQPAQVSLHLTLQIFLWITFSGVIYANNPPCLYSIVGLTSPDRCPRTMQARR